MRSVIRLRRASLVASSALLLAALIVALVAVSQLPEGSARLAPTAAAPRTEPASAGPPPRAVPSTEPAASSEPASSGPPRFADGEAASAAAESLIAPYIESQFATTVNDVACSEPPAGAIGDQFVCYGLKPGDLVIALRATIGADRVISLSLISEQSEPTDSSVPA